MVDNLNQVGHSSANPEAFEAGDVNDGKAVDTDNWAPVASTEGDKNNAFGAGFGPMSRDQNEHGRADFDLQVEAPDGTVYDAEGKFRYAIYGDTYAEDFLAKLGIFRAKTLRGAVDDATSEKPVIAAHYSRMAGDASLLRLEYQAAEHNSQSDESEEGYTLVAADSDADRGMPYGRLPTNRS